MTMTAPRVFTDPAAVETWTEYLQHTGPARESHDKAVNEAVRIRDQFIKDAESIYQAARAQAFERCTEIITDAWRQYLTETGPARERRDARLAGLPVPEQVL